MQRTRSTTLLWAIGAIILLVQVVAGQRLDRLPPPAEGPAVSVSSRREPPRRFERGPDGEEFEAETLVVKFTTDNGVGSPLAVERRPGSRLFKKFGRVRKRQGESLDEAIARISQIPGVAFVEKNIRYTNLTVPNDPNWADQTNLKQISMEAAWTLHTGSKTAPDNAMICIIDTGIDVLHPQLRPNIHPVYFDGWNAITNLPGAHDDYGHGVHVAGTIGAVGNDSSTITGILWNTGFMACKFLDLYGGGFLEDAIECIDWCLSSGSRILSNSWGGGGFSQALQDSIQAAGAMGALFVAAAGNSNANMDIIPEFYPANYPLDNIISVAAVDSADNLARFSNYGVQSTDIAAPGVGILSTYLNNDYAIFSGTSMAAPHVSGVASLLQSATGGKITSAVQLKRLIVNNADSVPTLRGIVGSNGQRLNAYKALQAALAVVTPDPLPALFSAKPLAVTAIPFTAALNLSTGSKFPVPNYIASDCSEPTVIAALNSSLYQKNSWKLTGLPGSGWLEVNDCGMTSPWDALTALFLCNPGTSVCSCWTGIDGCPGSGPGAGDRLLNIPLVAGFDYYVLVAPSDTARTSGAYTLELKVTPGTVSAPPPPPPVPSPPPPSPPPPSPPPSPPPPSPPPPSPPPPPPTTGFFYTQVTVGTYTTTTRPSFPAAVGTYYNLADGTAFALTPALITGCGTTTSTFRVNLANPLLKKQIWELRGLTRSFRVDTCQQQTKWNSYTTVLRCNTALTSCSACLHNNDGSCGTGAGGGDTSPNVPYSSLYRYFVVVYGANATAVGGYKFRITAV